jgi:hypothetical protein
VAAGGRRIAGHIGVYTQGAKIGFVLFDVVEVGTPATTHIPLRKRLL